jgi:hypothetical protein
LWKERVSIALDAACGLSHLHHSSPKVFHRDIKTPNILLDKNGTAKMADFGLACLSMASAHRVKQASGTVGYACPLYVQRGVVTEGSEVYSFGMVLLELLTASPPAYVGNGTAANQIQYLANHIMGDINIVLSLVDTKAQWTPPAARAIGDFALSCIKMQEEQRPNFAEIVRTVRSMHDGSALAAANSNASAAPAQAQPLMHGPGRPVAKQASTGPGRPPVANQAYSPPHRSVAQPPGVAPGSQPAGRHFSPPPQLPQAAMQQAPQPLQRYAQAAAARQSSPANRGYAAGPEVEKVRPPPQLVPDMALQAQQGLINPQMPAMPSQAPVLFTLECVFSEGISLPDALLQQRLIVHRLASEDDAIHGAPLPPLRVGRIFQTALFDALVVDDSARSTISREHFQVWAEETPSPPLAGDAGDSRIPCSFCLTNFSGNGTHVNDDHLQTRGERHALHHGDVITLSRSVTGPDGTHQARFIQFRFDLTDSYLREAEWFDAGASPRSDCSEESQRRPHSEDEMENTPCSDSFEGELAFILEVCGPGVHEVPLERRRIAYSPPVDDEEGQRHLYSALLVGRAHQLDFWQEVLHNEAFNTLSRQHFEVQTWRSASKEGSYSEASFSFLVRNLSDVNPVHVRSGPEETTEDTSMLEKGEQRHLLDGDEIVLNLNQEHTFWLIFRDLTKSTSIGNSPGGRFGHHEEGESPTFDHPFEINPAAVNAGRCALEADSRSMLATRPGQNHAAAVLRPPVSLLMGKDEDEISTTATPLDLLHDEQEEDEEDDDDATHIGMNPKGAYPGLRPRASSHNGSGLVGGAAQAAPLGARERDTLRRNSDFLPSGTPLVRDSRGVREDHRRTSSSTGPAGTRYARGLSNGLGTPWDGRHAEVSPAHSNMRRGW